MRNPRTTVAPSLLIAALVLVLPLVSYAQNREKFGISARAGGVNAVTGRATMRTRGNSDWQLLTIKEDLETGDAVRTGFDGCVELLLNPGSYLRIAENSEVELADNSLENLEVRLIRGTAIVEVTGAEDEELFIGITTPHARMSIVRRGLYRVNVVPGNTTELIVRKGRVMLEDSHTKVKGGNKVVFSSGSFSVAKLQKVDKKNADPVESWSKDRALTLAKANSKLTQRDLNGFLAGFNDTFPFLDGGRTGLWMYNPAIRCYTFLPFGYGWYSPYGMNYGRFFFIGGRSCCGQPTYGPVFGGVTGTGTGAGPGTTQPGGGLGNPSGPTYNPPGPSPSRGRPETTSGPTRGRMPE